jgi:hypothetical protein
MESEYKHTWALFWAVIIGFFAAALGIMFFIVPFWMCPSVVGNTMAPGDPAFSQLCRSYQNLGFP